MPSSSDLPVTVLLIGSNGLLGKAFSHILHEREKFHVVEFGRGDLNLTNPNSFEQTLDQVGFDILVNAAAYTSVDDCEIQGELAYLVNGQAPGLLAKICNRRGAKMLQFSTDFVFDGLKPDPYTEEDAANPLSVYGKSKLMGERLVLDACADHTVVRLSWLFGAGRPSFPEWVISRAQTQETLEVVSDKFACPTYSADVAAAVIPWMQTRGLPGGIWHFCQPEPCAWHDYAQHVLDCALHQGIELKTHKVTPIPLSNLRGLIAPRPLHSAMSTAKYTKAAGHSPRPWREAMAEYIQQQYPTPG